MIFAEVGDVERSAIVMVMHVYGMTPGAVVNPHHSLIDCRKQMTWQPRFERDL